MMEVNEASDLLEFPIAISPHFTQHDFELPTIRVEDKIAIFADRVRGWQLDIAERLVRQEQHSGYAVLSIVINYFEMIAKYEQGYEGVYGSQEHFVVGAQTVLAALMSNPDFGVGEDTFKTLYTDVRCGIYHSGLTVGNIVLTAVARKTTLPSGRETEVPVWTSHGGSVVYIYPLLLVHWIQRHFSGYVAQLLDPRNDELRQMFERRFDYAPKL